MTWAAATWRGIVIFLYFAFFTMWLPSRVVRLGALSDASEVVSDVVVLVVWGGFLVAGMVGLRIAQRRDLI